MTRPTPMTTWKSRSKETTRRTTWTLERARSCHSLRCLRSVLSHSFLAHRTMTQHVRVFVSFNLMVIVMHARVEGSVWLPWPFHHFHFLFSFVIILKQFLLPFNFPEVKLWITCALSPRRWGPMTSTSPPQLMTPEKNADKRTCAVTMLNDYGVTYFKEWRRRSLHRFYGRAQTYWSQSDVSNSQKPSYVMLTFETRIHCLGWFAHEILVNVFPMLLILRIGSRKRRNSKSDAREAAWKAGQKVC